MERGVAFSECTGCKAQFNTAIDQFLKQAGSSGGTLQSAIILYNEMRESPNDSQKLLRLLNIYLDLNEPGEAISASKTYPRALESSDACLTRAANAYWKLGESQTALQFATAALALNAANEEANAMQTKLLQLSPAISKQD